MVDWTNKRLKRRVTFLLISYLFRLKGYDWQDILVQGAIQYNTGCNKESQPTIFEKRKFRRRYTTQCSILSGAADFFSTYYYKNSTHPSINTYKVHYFPIFVYGI